MPRTYVRKPGSRKYSDYSEETLEEALNCVADGKATLLSASKKFGIPYGTLHNRFKGVHGRKAGGQPALLEEEEKAIVACLLKCSNWGFPLSKLDVQLFVKNYLERVGKVIRQFKNGCYPGKDWVDSFVKRHSHVISSRYSSNITTSRASVSREIIKNYFENLKFIVDNVPPSHIYNYDETNISDDPGKKKLIFKRGIKYPEKICNHSKSATTIMFSCSADGTLLPPYIIYKSEHLWDTWTQNGPKGLPCCDQPCCSRGCRYNRTKSGWIDSPTFTDWFETIFLPHANRQDGRKVLIGDNLSSHLNDHVIEMCCANNIDFVCLPSNATHICQPLDVSFFKSLKTNWRITLTDYKFKNPKTSGISKERFPNLIRECLSVMDKTKAKTLLKAGDREQSAVKRIIINGFEACGIVPLDSSKVLAKIPGQSEDDVETLLTDSLTSFLKERRFGCDGQPRKKKTKVAVEAGKSISAANGEETSESEDEVQLDSSSSSSENESDEVNRNDIEMVEPSDDNVKMGVYVLVKVLSGKRKCNIFRYVSEVQNNIGGDEFEVVGLKSVDSSHTVFRKIDDDIFVVHKSDILAVLPQPALEGAKDRPKYKFNAAVDVKEN